MLIRLFLIAALALLPLQAHAQGSEFFEMSTDPNAQKTPGVDEYKLIDPGIMAPPEKPAAAQEAEENTDANAAPTPEEMESQRVLSMDEARKLYLEGAYEKILPTFEAQMKMGNVEAIAFLGIMYRDGQGVTADLAKGTEFIKQAAEQGNPLAQHHLAIMYFEGTGVEKDMTVALMWLNIALAYYPEGEEKLRARQDRDNLYPMVPRMDRERALDMARAWLEKKGEGHLLGFQ